VKAAEGVLKAETVYMSPVEVFHPQTTGGLALVAHKLSTKFMAGGLETGLQEVKRG